MTNIQKTAISRRTLLGAFAAVPVLAAAPVYAKTPGYLRGAGKIRRVTLRSGRTGESVDTIYWVEGQYIRPALEEINYFMRDWREDSVKTIDRRQIDIIAAAHNLLNTSEPFQMLSGYRSPRTNAMLRSKSRGVAKSSYHIKGMATDLRLSSRSVSQMARAAVACHGGGVGRYSGSNFVHMDCGPIRTWGR
ncbi:MAG: Tat pathway signal protein [Rhodobacteraceae bacterium]|nr:MAG: Tat pathway signal protein [Paracoccaceae bacterium]